MKLQALVLSLLATSALAAIRTEAEYEDFCAENDGTEDEIQPGYSLKYTCELLGPHTLPLISDIASAGDCAQLCQDKPGCTGSSWSPRYKSCSLGAGAGDTEAKVRTWSLYMEVVRPPPPEAPENGGSQEGVAICNRLRDKCLLEMENSSCGGGNGEGNPTDPTDPENPSQGAGGPSPGDCVEGETFMLGGKKWRMVCKRGATSGSRLVDGSPGSVSADSREECIKVCAAASGCEFAVFNQKNGGKGTCYLRRGPAGKEPLAATGPNNQLDIAVVVDE